MKIAMFVLMFSLFPGSILANTLSKAEAYGILRTQVVYPCLDSIVDAQKLTLSKYTLARYQSTLMNQFDTEGWTATFITNLQTNPVEVHHKIVNDLKAHCEQHIYFPDPSPMQRQLDQSREQLDILDQQFNDMFLNN